MDRATLDAIFCEAPIPSPADAVGRHLSFRDLLSVREACRLALRLSRTWRMGDIWDLAASNEEPGRLAHWLDCLARQASEVARPGSHGVPFLAFDFALAARACRWAARAAARQVGNGSAASAGLAGSFSDFALDALAAAGRCAPLALWQEAHEAHEDAQAGHDRAQDDSAAMPPGGPWPDGWEPEDVEGLLGTAAYVLGLPPREPLTEDEDMARSFLGCDLSELREARGWSQAELAKKAGVSGASACRAEGGKRVNKSIIQHLLDALGVPWRPEDRPRQPQPPRPPGSGQARPPQFDWFKPCPWHGPQGPGRRK